MIDEHTFISSSSSMMINSAVDEAAASQINKYYLSQPTYDQHPLSHSSPGLLQHLHSSSSSLSLSSSSSPSLLNLSLCDLSPSKIEHVSFAQLNAYHPVEDKIFVNEKEKLFAVFDGHGGDMCSRYISEKVPKLVLDKIARKYTGARDYGCILKSSFIESDTAFLNEHKFMLKNSPTGSCGVVVLERDGFLYICNLGDSRVQVARKDESGNLSTIVLTNDHNTSNESEVKKVHERTSDPFPIRANITSNLEGRRVGGVLMLTRAFGDGVFKRRDMSVPPFIKHVPYITSEPEINVHKIETSDEFAVIASDGLYEHFTPEQITHFIHECVQEARHSGGSAHNTCPQDIAKLHCSIAQKVIAKEIEKVAHALRKTVDEVHSLPNKKSFMDDTTVIVLFFKK